MTRPYRVKLTARLLPIFSGMAAFSTVLALSTQGRALSGDLRSGARRRLEAASRAAELLVESHLESLRERYLAVSGTPQFRATLEVEDGPTLRFYARQLPEKSGASMVAFLDRNDRPKARAGEELPTTSVVMAVREAAVLGHGASAQAVVSIPLRTDGDVVGRLLAIEPVWTSASRLLRLLTGALRRDAQGRLAGHHRTCTHCAPR